MTRQFMSRIGVLSLLFVCAPSALADDFFGEVETDTQALETDESPWSYRGWLQQKTGYGYREPVPGFARDDADLTRTETQLYGELDWRQSAWRLRLAGSVIHDWLPDLERAGWWSGYELTDQQESARDWRWEASDSFLSWQEGDWWVKGGYQTLAWGEAETQKVTDVLARRDQRWPGQEDLEDLRLPVPALRVTWNSRLDLVLLPDMPTDRLPAPYEEFDPYVGLRGNPGQATAINTTEGEDSGWALRWQHRRPGLDTQLILADVYSFDLAPADITFPEEPAFPPQRITFAPWRQQIVGLTMQGVQGNWLLKTEQAWHRGVRLMPNNPLDVWPEHDQWRAMVVAEYSGIQDLTLSGEYSWRYTRDHSPELSDDEWQTGLGLRASYTLFNERLALSGLGLRLNGNQGDLVRLSGAWEFSDRLTLDLTLVEYSAGGASELLYPYRHNDSLIVALRWAL